MDEFDVPVFRKSYELYKGFHLCLKDFPKVERYSLGQKCEGALLDVLESLLRASGLPRAEKLPYLDQASPKLNLFRVYLRLAKDIRALDTKRYTVFQQDIDEIGRMIGGWKRSLREPR